MAATIQIILRDNVNKLGKAGELVRVKPGYARNFLIPRGHGMPATTDNIEQIEHARQAAISRAARLRTSSEALAQKLSTLTVEIAKPAGEGDRLFGSVTSKDIADALTAKGYEVDRKLIVLPAPIKQLGEFEIQMRLSQGVTGSFKLSVVKAA